jgi:hypothetical protein
MLGKLGTLFRDSGIRMRLRRITKVKNNEGMRIRRTEATAPPIVDDFDEEGDDDDNVDVEVDDEAAGNRDELVEDVILEMSDEAEIVHEVAVPESAERDADFTALQAQLQAEVEEAEAITAQETQALKRKDLIISED